MEKEIRVLRVQIDGLAQLTKALYKGKVLSVDLGVIPTNQSLEEFVILYKQGLIINTDQKGIVELHKPKEIEKAVDSLYLAKAWLGKVLAELGTENPYKSGYKTVEDIEPTADVHRGIDHLVTKGNYNTDYNHIEKVDFIRTTIESLLESIKKLDTKDQSRELAIARTNTYNYLCEARFWLGFELQRIKEENGKVE